MFFAGAMTRLVLIRNGKLSEFRGDRSPISRNTAFDTSFTNHEISLSKGDSVYLFTDGYIDQFGGEKNKKYMFKRFEQLLLKIQDFPMAEQKTILTESHNAWKGTNEQIDDILVIGFRI